MFRWIRVRKRSSGFCLDNTPSIFLKNTPEPLPFQLVMPTASFSTASPALGAAGPQPRILPLWRRLSERSEFLRHPDSGRWTSSPSCRACVKNGFGHFCRNKSASSRGGETSHIKKIQTRLGKGLPLTIPAKAAGFLVGRAVEPPGFLRMSALKSQSQGS